MGDGAVARALGGCAWLLALLVLGCSTGASVTAPPARSGASVQAPIATTGTFAPCTAVARQARKLAGRSKQSAQARLLEACDAGVPSCCHEAALQHSSKTGYLTHSSWRAEQLFTLACEREHRPSCRAIGKPEQLDRACLRGDVEACAAWQGPAIVGLALHGKGCELGDRASCRRHAAALAPLRALGDVQYWSMQDPRFESVKHEDWGNVVLEPFAFTASGRHFFVRTHDDKLAALDARTGEVVAKPTFDAERFGKPTSFVRHRVGTHLFFSADLSASDEGPLPTEHGVFLRRVGASGDTGWQRLQRGAFRVGVPSAFSWDGRIAAGTVGRGDSQSHCPFGAEGVQRWEVATGKPLGELVPLPAGVTLNDVQIDLSPDAERVVLRARDQAPVESASLDPRLRDLEVGNGTRLDRILTSPDGKTVLLAAPVAGILRVQREPPARGTQPQDDELAWFRKLRLPLMAPEPPPRSAVRDCGAIASDGEVVLRVHEVGNKKARPLANRMVELRADIDGAPVRGGAEIAPVRGRTDQRGQLRLSGLRRVRWSPHLLDAKDREGSHVRGSHVDLSLRTGFEQDVSFWPMPKDRPSKIVLKGSVKRPDGSAAAGARVEGIDANQTALRESVADARGRFSIERADVAWLRASLPDGHVGHSSSDVWVRGEPIVIALRTPGTAAAERLRIVDDQGTPLSPEAIRKRFGLVVDDQGRAIDASCPHCTERCDASRILQRLRLEDTAVTARDDACEVRLPSASIRLDTNGKRYSASLRLLESKRGVPPWVQPKYRFLEEGNDYVWSDLPSGRYEIKVSYKQSGENQMKVELEPGQVLKLEVPEMLSRPLRGKIVDDQTGLPLTGFSIEAGRVGYETKTDAQGRFQFEHVGAGESMFRVGPTRLDTLYERIIEVEDRVPLDLGTIRVPRGR